MTNYRRSFVATALWAVIGAGCSDGGRQTLTAPTPTQENGPANTALIGDRSSASRPASSGEAALWASSNGWSTSSDGIVVEATESITAVDGTCPTKSLTIQGVPVALTSATTFTAPITCAGLAVGNTVKVTALLTFTSTGFTVTATHVAPGTADGGGDDDGGDDDDDGVSSGPGAGKKARGEGVIGAITGSCPTLTLIITGTRVSTTASTEYVNGSCETLRPGTKVTIDGELKPGGTAVAEKIAIQGVPPTRGGRVSGDGRVDTVSGSCPALELTVRGVKVVTDSGTTFTGGVCGDIQPGSHLDVTGDYDGTEVAATAVHIRKP